MDTTAIIMVAGVGVLVVLGVGFGLWSMLQRLKVRKHWKARAAASNGKFSGGFISNPMLELNIDGFDCRLLIVKYKHHPDRVVVHVTVPGLPTDFAAGALGASHAVGRAISGRGGTEKLSLDHVHSGWSLRGDDALALPRWARDPGFVEAFSALGQLDPDAVVEWTLVKYSTEDYPIDDAAFDSLVGVGLRVARSLTAMQG